MAAELLEESAEELYDEAPCGYLSTAPDGTIVKVNRTLLEWIGRSHDELVGHCRLVDLLTVGGRIYHETHYAPLLRMQGRVQEIAVELLTHDGSRLPVLLNSVLKTDDAGRPLVTRTTVFAAADRRRYEEELLRQRERAEAIAHTLQSTLLPRSLPAAAGLRIAVRYLPGTRGVEVGGDFYDVVELADGRLAITVGDVVGHDVTAAATMGQLRSVVRALVGDVAGPAALVDRLQATWASLDLERMATAVVAFLDPRTGAIRAANAGHPPPLILRGVSADFVATSSSPPLGVLGFPVEEWVGELPAGATLLLFTDGLVEHRTLPIDEGLDRFMEAALAAPSNDPDELCDHLLTALLDAGRTDDVALLAVTRDG